MLAEASLQARLVREMLELGQYLSSKEERTGDQDGAGVCREETIDCSDGIRSDIKGFGNLRECLLQCGSELP